MRTGQALRSHAAFPLFAARKVRRVASTLYAVVLTLVLACVVAGVVVVYFLPDPAIRLVSVAVVLAVAGASVVLARHDKVWAGSLLLVVALGTSITGGLAAVGNIYTPAIIGYPIVVLVAGLLLGTRSAVVTALLCGLVLALLGYTQREDALATLLATHTAASVWWIQATALATAAVFICLAVRRTEEALEEVEASEATLALRYRELESEVRTREGAEAKLRENKERYRALFQHTKDGIAEIDSRGNVRFMSPSFQKSLASDPGQAIGRNVFDWVHPDDLARARSLLRRLMKRGFVQAELRYRSADGGWRWTETTATTFRVRDGELRAVIVSRDVSRRRRAEDRLRESEERYRTLAENAREIIAEFDRDEGLIYLSPSVMPIMGYAPEELLGSSAIGIAHPADRKSIAAGFRDSLESPLPVEVALNARHRDGSWRRIEASSQRFEAASGARRLVVVARDVTERRDLERRFLQSQKLEAVARLAGGIAHDFNNLLTVVSGHVEMLLDREIGEQERESLEQVEDAASRAISLVQQLLAFSRNQVREPRVIDVNEVLGEMDRLLRRLIGEDVELVTRLGTEPLCANVDPSQLEQIIANLAVNARDAIADTGHLVIETKRRETAGVFPAGGAGDDWLEITVSDTGVGISEEIKQRIFDPFFTTKEPGKGTGLGLSTVHGIVEQSGGYLEVESEPGAGTTFRIFLPRVDDRRSESPAREASRRGDAGAGTETVLLVEDEPSVRRFVSRVLAAQGYRVLEASNGNEALDLARGYEGAIDLLLTDLVMPVMGGAELHESLIAERPTLRTLFMSGYQEHPSGSHAAPVPAERALSKPFGSSQLTQRVREVLSASAHGRSLT
jgi:two-component system cell cycle sensor histidine kinase/response regulator CckA